MAKRVLVIDDDVAVLEALETALTYEEFEVIAMASAGSIFKIIEETKPDIILLDFVLEGLTGGEICRHVKSNPSTKHLPVIIISAYQGDIGSLKSFGCDHFIPKPFSLIDLINGIKETLEKGVISL